MKPKSNRTENAARKQRNKTEATHRAAWIMAAILLLFCASGKAQNASPLGGVGNLQFFDNTGAILTSGVVYIYQAGTSTQATVYVDSTGTTTQPNPVTFGSGARAGIWLANGTFVKVVLCAANDGAFCSAGDILFSADQVPIGSTSSGGGGSPFTGIFISSTASPATSGTLRLSSGDSTCWRNAAGSANICWSKNSNDILQWGGGSLQLPEIAAPTCGLIGADCWWADSTAHRIKSISNGGTAAQFVLSGNDIGTTDQVLGVHFGATQQTFGNTALTTNQYVGFNGTNLVGLTPEYIFGSTGVQVTLSNTQSTCATVINTLCPTVKLVAGHTLIRFDYVLAVSPAGCATQPQIGVYDVTGAANLFTTSIANGATTGFVDSGVLSVAITAGHQISVGLTTVPAGCGTNAQVESYNMVYQ